jgi:hypothetical protein
VSFPCHDGLAADYLRRRSRAGNWDCPWSDLHRRRTGLQRRDGGYWGIPREYVVDLVHSVMSAKPRHRCPWDHQEPMGMEDVLLAVVGRRWEVVGMVQLRVGLAAHS